MRHKSKTIIWVATIVLLVSVCLVANIWFEDTQTHKVDYKNLKFTVEIPKNWLYIGGRQYSYMMREGPPDDSLTICIGKKVEEGLIDISINKYKPDLSVYTSHEDFETEQGKQGTLYSGYADTPEDTTRVFVLAGKFIVNIRSTDDCYERNEKKILKLLKSIYIY